MATQTVRYQINGMSCQACASRIEKVLNRQPSVSQASVNFASEQAQIRFDDHLVQESQIQQWIEQAGFEAMNLTSGLIPDSASTSKSLWRLKLLFVVAFPFVIAMVQMMLGFHHDWLTPQLQFVLASVVQLGLAWPFYRGAFAALRNKMANMDVLVSLGTSVIYGYSAAVFLLGQAGRYPLYFEAGVMVITFVSLGKYLELRSKRESLNSLSLLLAMTPDRVNVLRDGRWKSVALASVRSGELLRAVQGDKIAADGKIEKGQLWCDESHLTGESNIIEKQAGDQVLAGSMVSDGSATYQAQALGKNTLLGDMMAALSEAQGSKAPIARIADRLAAVFVPIVVAIALLTFALTWWLTADSVRALVHAVSVLVIACPCAMGLATPAAIMVGMGKAVSQGVWFKDAAALESASRIDTVVLDKTGTLTEGRPQVVGHWLAREGMSYRELLQIAASVEIHGNHPLARAICEAAEKKGLVLHNASAIRACPGEGVLAEVDGVGMVKVGKPAFTGVVMAQLQAPVWQIASLVTLSVDDQPIGALAVADALKADSKAGVARLQALGLRVEIMSGDQPAVVKHIAEQLGIDVARGGMTPREKAAAIEQLQSQGHQVAMVGDGVNDSPALTIANVSFAMKGGADVAQNTASATLMRHSVDQIADALGIARATVINIKQNLFFAFIYNILGIPLAAFGLLSPVVAGLAMALSSVSVLGNALRLKRWQSKR